jgi:hypothetical protein
MENCSMKSGLKRHLASSLLLVTVAGATAWESTLFPSDEGRYARATLRRDDHRYRLPDFSFAGYRAGEEPIPDVPVAITLTPQPGDNAVHINRAIRRLSKRTPGPHGFRGTILLDKGTFEIQSQIRIFRDGIVIAGNGPGKTYVYVNSTDFARKSAFLVQGPDSDNWLSFPEGERRYALTADAADQDTFVVVEPGHPFAAGDTVIVRQWPTRQFARAHGANGINIWPVTNDNTAPKYCRVVRSVSRDTLFFDEPLRYALGTKHGAHVFRAAFLHGVGIQDLSIGFRKGPDTDNNGRTHRAAAITMYDVVNGWVKNVHSYKRDDESVHLQSYGFTFRACKWLTIENCTLQDPQNKNVGGNGYLFNPVCSDDLLFRTCTARNGRHNFTIHYSTSGCVFTGCRSENSRSDFHQYLATENLFDNFTMAGDSLTAGNRGDKSQGSWWCSSKATLWNLKGEGAVYLNSFGAGYLIGAEPGVRVGVGATGILQDYGLRYQPHRQWIETGEGPVEPASLYEAQVKRRRDRTDGKD